MSLKDRVNKALKHELPDAIPIDFGSSAVTGIHVSCVAALRDYYGLEKRPVKVHEPYQMLGLVEEDLQAAMGIAVEGVFPPDTMFGFKNENWKEWTLDSGLKVLISGNMKITRDEKGDTLVFPKGDTSAPPSGRMPKGGFFFDTIIRQDPIDEANLDPKGNMEEFSVISDENIAYFSRVVEDAFQSGKGVLANFGGTAFGDIALVPAPFLKYPKGIRDIEEWYISTVTRQDYIHKVFDYQCEIALQNLEKIFNVINNKVDAVFLCGTDFGTQQSTFCSTETFRNLYMPYYKRINDWIHAHTNWKTFKHSCGAVEPLINDFIESGFDILNPVQVSASGMDARLLKEKYGDKIVFWGGGVDTQKTLPFGTPEDVRKQVLERCEIFGQDGGFVFNSIHNIQANTPVENIVSMIEAVHEFNAKS